MSDKLRVRICNDKHEYLQEMHPIAWTNNIADALVSEEEADKVDISFVSKNILNVIEEILSSGYKDSLEVVLYTDKDDSFYICNIKKEARGIAVVGSINTEIKISSELDNCIRFITSNIQSEIQDIYFRALGSASLSSAISDMKKALGMTSADLSKTDDLDKLCEEISSETKAEIVKPKETLADYVCNDTLRQELDEIKDFFENSKVYKDANIDIPKGILFKGPWGTGKTYAARCIAGSVDCYFMTCTASALQGMYIGSGADNIRQVFKGAKLLAEKSKKGVILFIDELDSFGDRMNRSGGASGEEDRTLNQLLAEMSGFTEDHDIMVLAATNFPERLDSALMRSGRFGRQITIDYPDDTERMHLVKYYFEKKNIPLEKSITFEDIADLTEGLTPADIKEISNEAGILSIRNKQSEIKIDNINEAINKVITKNIRKPDGTKEELHLVTVHECGHVLAEFLYNNTVPIKVTNYAYGDAGGFTQPSHNNEGMLSQDKYITQIKMLLGGRVAEAVVCGYITTGASSDLKKATNLLVNYYKIYNFEHYEYDKVEQIALDKLTNIYEEMIKDFNKIENRDILLKLIDDLLDKRVLYKSDLTIHGISLLKGTL